MKTIVVLNGPNLNDLGKREKDIYGEMPLRQFQKKLEAKATALGLEVVFEQSNHEGTLIDLLQAFAEKKIYGLILNAGGLSHTSVSLRDTIAYMPYPVVEVHLSNIYAREPFRHFSLLSAVCQGSISGLGPIGYELALEYLAKV